MNGRPMPPASPVANGDQMPVRQPEAHWYAESRVPEPRRRDWLQSVWWRRLWSDRAARDPFTGFLVREYRRLTDG